MKISLHWLQEMGLPLTVSVKELGEVLTQRGLEVEGILEEGASLRGLISARILQLSPHPAADRLQLCRVDAGDEPLEIVCGATNMRENDGVVLAPVGTLLPGGMVIRRSKIRGVLSEGMLCSAAEMGLEDPNPGLYLLPTETPVGIPIAQLLGRTDTTLTLKVAANRGDCLSHLGIIRECASHYGFMPRRSRIWDEVMPSALPNVGSEWSVEGGERTTGIPLVRQFHAIALEGLSVGPSPAWLVKRLEAIGARSVNAVVDATQFIQFECGQPVHAYDLDQIHGRKLFVDRAQTFARSLRLLDGSTTELGLASVCVRDERSVLALAGVMGGADSAVQLTTRRLLLECAEFDPQAVRRSAQYHRKASEAAKRFEKGVDPASVASTLGKLAALILHLAGGQLQSHSRIHYVGNVAMTEPIRMPAYSPHALLGLEDRESTLSLARVEEILTGLNCRVELDLVGDGHWRVWVPSYRHDLQTLEDLVEEIGRCIGYQLIPSRLPAVSQRARLGGSVRQKRSVRQQAKDALCALGLSEAVNFAFTSRARLEAWSCVTEAPILNPLTEDHAILVPSLLPGLLHNVLERQDRHFGAQPLSVRLFEMRSTFHRDGAAKNSDIWERLHLAWLMTGTLYAQALDQDQKEVDFYDLKAVLDRLLEVSAGSGMRQLALNAPMARGHALFHPGQSLELWRGTQVVGHVGRLHPQYQERAGLKSAVYLAEIDWELFLGLLPRPAKRTEPFYDQSFSERDFSLVVPEEISADKIVQAALKAGAPLAQTAKVFDVYRGPQVQEKHHGLGIRMRFYTAEGPALEEQVEASVQRILEAWNKNCRVRLR